MFPIEICVLLISVSGIPFIWYNSTVEPLSCADAVPSSPLLVAVIVFPVIVPCMTSLPILTNIKFKPPEIPVWALATKFEFAVIEILVVLAFAIPKGL